MLRVHIGRFCLIGLLLAGLWVGLVAYRHITKTPDTLVSIPPQDKDMSLNHIHHVATRNGVKEWILDAESAEYQKAEKKTVFKHISATFFLKDGRSIHLTGCSGVLLTDTKDMEVSGDVVARSGPYELNTEKLLYDHKGRSISTDKTIVLKGNGVDMTGENLVFDFDTERAVVSGGVAAVFKTLRLL